MKARSKWLVGLGVLVVLGFALAACQPTEVVKTVEVEKEVVVTETVEVTVEVEVTAEPTPVTRTGAWVDSVIFVEEPESDIAVSRLEAGDLDVYAFNISEPDIAKRIKESDALEYAEAFGSYNELTFNPSGPVLNNGKLNPFAVAAIREAMNWLVDRDYIVNEIVGGLGRPRYVPINLASKDFAELADVIAAIELTYAYNPDKAREVITAEMEKLGAELVDGKWTYEGEPVELIGLIRVEDERKEIGDYVSNQLEELGFKVVRDYKTSREAATCWIFTDPAEGCFSFYTGGWVSTVISRDEATNFGDFYTPRGWGVPLWQAYQPLPEFDEVAGKLYTSDFNTPEERRELMEQALWLALKDSARVWLFDATGVSPYRKEVSISSDLSGSVYGSQLWAQTVRFDDRIGGSITIGMPSIMTEPWNPLGGSNWIYDQMPIRGTGEFATLNDPFTGLNIPNRIERAEVTVEQGLPVGVTLDWVTLDFADKIEVPADAWADWDAAEQKWITVGEKYPDGVTVKRKTVVYYPEDLYDTVKWHDGSPFDLADIVMFMIQQFDRAKEDSPYYDESEVPSFDSFMESFRGVRIVSEDPLVIETYSDFWQLDAEEMVETWWPMYGFGQAAWHTLAPGLLADGALEAAFSADKADANEVERLSYIAGPTIEILKAKLDEAQENGFIPYANTLGQYVSADEAEARYSNLQEWFRRRGHFWVGTGPFYLERAFPVEGTLILKRNPEHPDLVTKWLRFSEPAFAEVAIDGPSQVKIGEEATFDINVTFKGEPYAIADINLVKYLVFDATGALAHVGEAEAVEDGLWRATLGADVTSALAEGSNQLRVVVGPLRVLIPTIQDVQFVTVP